jgi:glycosyltransferase involved in cell wall biosynthesis
MTEADDRPDPTTSVGDAAHQLEKQRAEYEKRLRQAIIHLEKQRAEFSAQIAAYCRRTDDLQRELNALQTSTIWRASRHLRAFLARYPVLRILLRRSVKLAWWTVTGQLATRVHARRLGVTEPSNRTSYASWIENFDFDSKRDTNTYLSQIEVLSQSPTISVLMPTYNTPESYLRQAIESVRKQIYTNWELCIADDCSDRPHVRGILEKYAADDQRIKVTFRDENGHISEATNTALSMASGHFLAMLDHDDVLPEHALVEVAIELNKNPHASLIYTDEDKIDDEGKRFNPYFKPDFSPELLYGQNYLNHLSVFRADAVRAIGGWRKGYEGSQDYDLILRLIRQLPPNQIRHIPKVLYHWRVVKGSTAYSISEKSYALTAGLKALKEHLWETEQGHAALVDGLPYYRAVYPIPQPAPLVTLIIPTKDQQPILERAIDSILGKTTYDNYEIIIVDNNSEQRTTIDYLSDIEERHSRVSVLRYPAPFNYSAINNFAARHAKGSILAFINNDVEVINGSWLQEMVSQVSRQQVGCVGAMLYYPDNTIQHAGIVLGIGGVAGHSHKRFPRGDSGYFARLKLAHNVSAVTAACMLLRRSVFEEVGGFDDGGLAVAFNDVDLCLRVREAGYLNVFTPFAELYHHESISRGYEDNPEKKARFESEVKVMLRRWGDILANDPFYSPHLTLTDEDFSLREPGVRQLDRFF